MSDSCPTSHYRSNDPSFLNWVNRDELLGSIDGFTLPQQHLLKLLQRKQDEYPEGFDEVYFSNATALIAANDKRAEKLTCCGRMQNGKRIPCNLWHYCPRCAYYRQLTARGTFMSAFEGRGFYFLTLSFEGNLHFNVTNNTRILAYWGANESAIRQLVNDGIFLGAYFVHELALIQFSPIRVLPHTHAIIHADTFWATRREQLCTAVSGFHNDFGEVTNTPSIHVAPINCREEFYRRLGYCTKALDIATPYQLAFDRVVDESRSKIPALNTELRNFLEEYP